MFSLEAPAVSRPTEKLELISKRWRKSPAFTQPLTFGNLDQIKALRAWTREIEKAVEEAEALAAGQYRRWTISYTVLADREAVVIAQTREEARTVLEDEAADEVFEVMAMESDPLEPDDVRKPALVEDN